MLLNLLNETFNKSTIAQIENNYLHNLKSVLKWMCFSDYCLDNKEKPNDVVTFSIMPYIMDFPIIENYIKVHAKTDIKHTSTVNKKFIEFLNKYPMINFSFILNDRKSIFGNTHDEVKINLKKSYTSIKEMYDLWIKNEPKRESYYKHFVKKIDSCINNINYNKKIKQLIDVILIPFLGAYVSSIVLNRIDKLETYGWFSDRDKIMDIEDGIASDFFHNNLHILMKNKIFEYVTSVADCKFDIFYDNYIKIPDYIVGTLADYNLDSNLVSKDKFNTILTDYMSSNKYNNHIFRVFRKDNIYCEKIGILKK